MRYRLKHILLAIIVGAAFLLLVLPALAQEKLTEKYTFESGATFSYPKAWKLNEKINPLIILSEQTRLFVLDYANLQAIGVDIKSASQNDILKIYFSKAYPDRAFKESKIEPLEIGKRKGIQYDYSADDGRARVMVIPFTNGSAGIVEEISLAGKLREEDTVLALVESFENTEEITGTTTNTTVAPKPVNCTVSTTRDDTVQVRVGPGENRSSIVFLSAGSSYKVLGQAKAKDGSKWWKLDKSEVAPDKAANEVWVKQDDVKAKGDCDKVTDVNAPPVVPIVNAPPSVPAAGNDTGSSNPPPSGGGNTPLSGSWTVNFGDGKESCSDISSFDLMPAARQDTFNVVVANSSLIYVDGGPLVRNGNTFSGAYDLTDNTGATFNRKLILQVISPTQMNGTLIDTAMVEGHLCSATLPITMTKN